ncbi:hypothetical protein D3C71_1955820 [compost metagenome]
MFPVAKTSAGKASVTLSECRSMLELALLTVIVSRLEPPEPILAGEKLLLTATAGATTSVLALVQLEREASQLAPGVPVDVPPLGSVDA